MPFMNRSFYKKVLLFMVSLAVGVLGGSGLFHLLPQVSVSPFMNEAFASMLCWSDNYSVFWSLLGRMPMHPIDV